MQFSLLRSIKYFVLNTHCCDCLFVVVPGIIVRVTRNPAGYYSVRTHMSYNVQQQQYLLPGNIIMPACPTRRIHENDNGTFVTRLCPFISWYILVYYIPGTGYSCSYSSCRYNERQLIHVTVVRRVRPRAERSSAG